MTAPATPASPPVDDSRQRHAAQTALLVALDTRTRIYPTFASVDRSGEVPVVTEVTLTWDEFQVLAQYALQLLQNAPLRHDGETS